jgi:hypothetical protein
MFFVVANAAPVTDDPVMLSLAQPPTIAPNNAMAPITLTDRSAMVFPFLK